MSGVSSMGSEPKSLTLEESLQRFRCLRDMQMQARSDNPDKIFDVPPEVMAIFQREHDLIRHLLQFPCEVSDSGVVSEYIEVRDYKHAWKTVKKLVEGGHCVLGQPVNDAMLLTSLATEYKGKDAAYYQGFNGEAWLDAVQMGREPHLPTVLRVIIPQWVARYQLRQKAFYAKQLMSRINEEQDPFPVQRDWEIENKRALNENDGLDVGKTLSQILRAHDPRDKTLKNLIPLGFAKIDRANGGGVGRGDMVVVGGGTGGSKSYFAQRMLMKQAEMQRHALHISIEDPEEIMAARTIADFSGGQGGSNSGVRPADIRQRTADVALVEAAIERGVTVLGDFIHYVDAPKASVSEVCRLMRKARNLYHVDMVIVDYLQAVQADDPTNQRTNDVALAVTTLKKCAKEIGIALVLMSQYSRDEYRDNQEPGINACKWAGEIENETEVMILLWRDEDGILHCKVAKLKWSRSDQLRFTIDVDPNTGVLLEWHDDPYGPKKDQPRRSDRGNGQNKPN
jgi:KaiC/GvpD/RAD55 family RecA-like ATPase